MEQKIDHLNEMTSENTQRLQDREDTALQYKRYTMFIADRDRHDVANYRVNCCMKNS